jgi:hypothetical protein
MEPQSERRPSRQVTRGRSWSASRSTLTVANRGDWYIAGVTMTCRWLACAAVPSVLGGWELGLGSGDAARSQATANRGSARQAEGQSTGDDHAVGSQRHEHTAETGPTPARPSGALLPRLERSRSITTSPAGPQGKATYDRASPTAPSCRVGSPGCGRIWSTARPSITSPLSISVRRSAELGEAPVSGRSAAPWSIALDRGRGPGPLGLPAGRRPDHTRREKPR